MTILSLYLSIFFLKKAVFLQFLFLCHLLVPLLLLLFLFLFFLLLKRLASIVFPILTSSGGIKPPLCVCVIFLPKCKRRILILDLFVIVNRQTCDVSVFNFQRFFVFLYCTFYTSFLFRVQSSNTDIRLAKSPRF